MKKRVKLSMILLFLSLLAQHKVLAQETFPKHTVKVSAGYISLNRTLDFLGDGTGQVVNVMLAFFPWQTPHTEVVNRQYSLVHSFKYGYALHPDFQVGISASFERSTGEFTIDGEKAGSVERKYYNLAAEGQYYYLNKPAFKLYGLLGLGLTWSKPEAHIPDAYKDFYLRQREHPSFQVTPIGFRVGKKLGLSAAMGFGYAGFLSAGLDYKF